MHYKVLKRGSIRIIAKWEIHSNNNTVIFRNLRWNIKWGQRLMVWSHKVTCGPELITLQQHVFLWLTRSMLPSMGEHSCILNCRSNFVTVSQTAKWITEGDTKSTIELKLKSCLPWKKRLIALHKLLFDLLFRFIQVKGPSLWMNISASLLARDL